VLPEGNDVTTEEQNLSHETDSAGVGEFAVEQVRTGRQSAMWWCAG